MIRHDRSDYRSRRGAGCSDGDHLITGEVAEMHLESATVDKSLTDQHLGILLSLRSLNCACCRLQTIDEYRFFRTMIPHQNQVPEGSQ